MIVIRVMWNLFEETLRAQIRVARRALPTDAADFVERAICARDIWVLDSGGVVVHYLF